METRRGLTSTFMQLLAGGVFSGLGAAEAAASEAAIAQSAAALAASMSLLHGGQWLACVNHQSGFILVHPGAAKVPSGPIEHR